MTVPVNTCYTSTAAGRLAAIQKSLTSSISPSNSSCHMAFTSHQSTPNGSRNNNAEVQTYQHPSGICKICLNRPKKLNALSYTMCDIIVDKIMQWENSDTSKLYLIKSNDNKAFCAGGDIKGLFQLAQENKHEEITSIFNKQYRLDHLLGTLKKPYIALMDGIVMGDGVGLAMNGPFRIATENTLFAMPETAIGLFSDASSAFWMIRLDGYVGFYLGLTGKRLRGPDLLYPGIATHYVPSKNLNQMEAALNDLALTTQGALRQSAINAVIEQFSADLEQEPPFSLNGTIYKAINRCFKYDTMEDIIAALKNEEEAVEWAKETLDTLSNMSPTSMKISLQLYHTGARLSFIDCMRMEYQVASKCVGGREFSEGTRATLITRTKPNWDPSTLEQVDANEIKRFYFDTPLSSSLQPVTEGGHYKEYPHTRFTLPKCSEILEVADNIEYENTVKFFIGKYNGKQGTKAKVISILNI